MKKLSVITINKNHLEGLISTFRSIKSQTCQDFEFIVIDGASTDGSAEFLEQHKSMIDYYISEPDHGIYNAMNKGIRYADGDYCLFMNSGDVFYDGKVIEKLLPYLDGRSSLIIGESIYPDGFIHKAPSGMKLKYFWSNSLPHQATFIARELFIQHGYYRENYRCASDMFFFFEMIYLKKVPCRIIPVLVCSFEGGGVSGTGAGRNEMIHYMKYYMPFFYCLYCRLLIWYAPVATLRRRLCKLFSRQKKMEK